MRSALVSAIHKCGGYFSVALAGGGAQGVADLTSVPGASQCLLQVMHWHTGVPCRRCVREWSSTPTHARVPVCPVAPGGDQEPMKAIVAVGRGWCDTLV